MERPHGPRCLSLLLVALAGTCGLLPASGAAQTPPPPAATAAREGRADNPLFDLPVPGGLTGLLAAADLPPAPRPVALLNLIRALHIRPAITAGDRRRTEAVHSHLRHYLDVTLPTTDTVPLPLSPQMWMGTVFKGAVTADPYRLLPAILADRRASFLYVGLLSLDDATLAFLASHPELLSAIYEQAAGALASCGRAIHIRDNTMVLPGGAGAVTLWEAVVGERAASPERFVLALLTRDAGRCAYFLDAIAHLDPARQAFALGSAAGGRREGWFRSLYASVARFGSSSWHLEEGPFVRQPIDPAFILMQLQVSRDGRMAPPRRLAFWRAALDGNAGACISIGTAGGGADVDASWLMGRLLREGPRRVWLNAILFAQRVFSSVPAAELGHACEVMVWFPRYAGLMVTLERFGLSAPGDYLAAVTFAQGLAQSDSRTTVLALAQVQAILAVLERVAAVSPSDRPVARELVQSLVGLPAGRAGRPGTAQASGRSSAGRVGEWMKTVLLPRLCHGQQSADVCLEEAVSGLRATGRSLPIIDWEGQRYRVDAASGLRTRLSRIRQRQQATTLDAAMALVGIGLALRDGSSEEGSARQQAAALTEAAGRLDGTTTLFGADVSWAGPALLSAAGKLLFARGTSRTASEDVLGAADVVLADALASFAYAMAIGNPDDALLLAGDPARRHDFDVGGAGSGAPSRAWQPAEQTRQQATGWVMQGSLLGLSRACADSWQRRLSIDVVAGRPTLDARATRGFAEAAAALNPFDLSDAGRSELAAAIRRGRDALAGLVRDPQALVARASEIGVSEWRSRGAIWMARHDPGAVADLFALAELLWLGNPKLAPEQVDAWGVPTRPLDGSLGVWMPRGHAWEDLGGRDAGLLPAHVADLNLRVVMWLDEAQLPAALMPGIVSFATWDLVTSAQPVDPDDWLAVVRAAQAIPSDRLADYVSALTADGTLMPVR